MKKMIRYSSVAFVAMIWLSANAVFAQVESTTTTTSGGTITDFTPKTFSVRTATAATPVRYTYTRTTTYVDENGNPVSVETVRSGAPVTVYYDRQGDQMVAQKVVVRKTVTSSDGGMVTTDGTAIARESNANMAGTVTEYTPNAIVVRTDSSTLPISYSSTRTTTYVDENGNPVSTETVRSGAPVTVYYDRNGDQLVATRVVVHTTTQPDGTVIEHKKTTTTTTETKSE